MIVDSSAIIAILRDEIDAVEMVSALRTSQTCLLPTPTYLELCMVAIGGREADTLRDVDDIISRYKIRPIAFSAEAAELAVQAFILYGKGRGHPAQLNFGDCMSYAAAKVEAMPLLFKGDDFRHTDVECAV